MAQREVTVKLKLEGDKGSLSEAKAVSKSVEVQRKEVEKLNKEYLGYREASTTAYESAASSSVRALQGVTDLGKGLAYLGITSEENLEKFMRGVVSVEAGVSILRGSVDGVYGVVRAVKELEKAYLASAAAKQTLLALGGLESASVLAAGGGARKGKSGVGGFAANMAGDAALVGGTTLMQKGMASGSFSGSVANAGKALAPMAASAGKVVATFAAVAAAGTLVQDRLATYGEYLGLWQDKSFLNSFFEWRQEVKNAEESTKRLTIAEQKRADMLNNHAQREALIGKVASQNATMRGMGFQKQDALSQYSLDTPEQQNENYRLRGIAELQQAEAELGRVQAENEERQRQRLMPSFAAQLAARERIQSATERVIDAEERSLSLSKQAIEAERQKIDQLKTQSELIGQKIDAEKNTLKGQAARFADLDPGARNKLKGIADKVKGGGDLSVADAKYMNHYGFGRDMANDRLAEHGRSLGYESISSAFGEDKQLTKAQADLLGVNSQMDQSQAKVGDLQGDHASKVEKLNALYDKLIDNMAKSIQTQNQQSGAKIQSNGSGGFEVIESAGSNEAVKELLRQAAEKQEKANQNWLEFLGSYVLFQDSIEEQFEKLRQHNGMNAAGRR